ncbi:MAG: O-antigen ligase family protein [Leptospira sp.]|nr:O-antigen ligase family protein [Leptospira sp.]
MIYRTYLVFLTLSIISCALSVSLSQVFLALSFILFLFLNPKPKFQSYLVKVLFLFYGWQIISFCYHYIGSGLDSSFAKHAFNEEMKDIFLVSAFFTIQGIKAEDRKYLYRVLVAFAITIAVTGFISLFSSVRLSRLVSDLYKVSPSWKFQHHYGSVLGIDVHLPIGFMNTHLTFGGLLMFIYPFFIFHVYDLWKTKAKIIRLATWILLLGMVTIVFLFNNARSALIGMGISLLLGFYVLAFVENAISTKILKRAGISFLFFLAICFVGYKTSEPVQKVINPLFGGEKHTDSGRTFIWHSTYPLIQTNPIFGIGSGKYKEEIELSRKQLSFEEKELSFFYEVTQRGHSHNDYLHLMTIFGVPQFILYLSLMSLILFTLLKREIPNSTKYLTYGLGGFFFSGILQCYFQDDEVLIVFMFLLGYLNIYLEKESAEV